MIKSQKEKFNLPNDISYLNCANIAPLMNKLSALGKDAINLRERPYKISREDWFLPTENLKHNFAKLINCDNHKRIAIIPSVSYGVATVAKNIKLNSNEEILVVDEQYPSNYYSWVNISEECGAKIKIITPPNEPKDKGRIWNERILDAITEKTRIVALGNIHWTDGTLFHLQEISKKAKLHGSLLIIDGSQSIGALPFDISNIKPDAVFAVGYKWLLGPFSLGLAYFGEYFDNGSPLEENWINRKDSDNFQSLVDYTPQYRSLAGRYNVGENSNFHLTPIMNGAIEQLNDWKVENIQTYCKNLIEKPIDELKSIGCVIEDDNYRSSHLFGIRFNDSINLNKLQNQFIQNKVYVSLRGTAVRVSVNVYNDENDMERLVSCIGNVVN